MRALPIILLTAAGYLPAQVVVPPDPLEALVRDSPFLPGVGTARPAAAGDSGPLELRSIVFEQGTFFFSIHDQGSGESQWVTLGQPDLPFVARSYNREEEILTVEHQGRTLALKLQFRPAPMPAPAPLPSPAEAARPGGPQPVNSSPGGQGPPLPNMTPGESQRLQELADEIRRRRQPVQLPKN